MRTITDRISIKREVSYEIEDDTKRAWSLVLRFKHEKDGNGELSEGHRYWVVHELVDKEAMWPGKVAVADMSGDVGGGIGDPEETEDGVLWLDYGRPILIGHKGEAAIPVISARDGERLRTGERFSDALLVAEKFGLKIKCGAYTVEAYKEE